MAENNSTGDSSSDSSQEAELVTWKYPHQYSDLLAANKRLLQNPQTTYSPFVFPQEHNNEDGGYASSRLNSMGVIVISSHSMLENFSHDGSKYTKIQSRSTATLAFPKTRHCRILLDKLLSFRQIFKVAILDPSDNSFVYNFKTPSKKDKAFVTRSKSFTYLKEGKQTPWNVSARIEPERLGVLLEKSFDHRAMSGIRLMMVGECYFIQVVYSQKDTQFDSDYDVLSQLLGLCRDAGMPKYNSL